QIEGNFSADYGFSSTLTTRVWRGGRAAAPGGALTNLRIHHLDTYHYLLAPLARVLAFVRRLALPNLPLAHPPSILFEFASGSVGYLGTSWVHANRTETITVHGTEAQAWHEASGARLFLARRGQAERKELPLTPADAVVEELTEFARCVRDRVRPEV